MNRIDCRFVLYIFCLTAFISIFMIGCYTTLLHPRLEVAEESGELSYVYVEHVDDCSQCHQSYPGHSQPVGLGAAAELESWRFYYEYPWWTDSYFYGTNSVGSSEDMQEARDMGRRRNASAGDHFNPTTTAVSTPPTPVLTKSVASEENDSSEQNASSQDDSRRSVGRRKQDTSGSKKRPDSGRRSGK